MKHEKPHSDSQNKETESELKKKLQSNIKNLLKSNDPNVVRYTRSATKDSGKTNVVLVNGPKNGSNVGCNIERVELVPGANGQGYNVFLMLSTPKKQIKPSKQPEKSKIQPNQYRPNNKNASPFLSSDSRTNKNPDSNGDQIKCICRIKQLQDKPEKCVCGMKQFDGTLAIGKSKTSLKNEDLEKIRSKYHEKCLPKTRSQLNFIFKSRPSKDRAKDKIDNAAKSKNKLDIPTNKIGPTGRQKDAINSPSNRSVLFQDNSSSKDINPQNSTEPKCTCGLKPLENKPKKNEQAPSTNKPCTCGMKQIGDTPNYHTNCVETDPHKNILMIEREKSRQFYKKHKGKTNDKNTEKSYYHSKCLPKSPSQLFYNISSTNSEKKPHNSKSKTKKFDSPVGKSKPKEGSFKESSNKSDASKDNPNGRKPEVSKSSANQPEISPLCSGPQPQPETRLRFPEPIPDCVLNHVASPRLIELSQPRPNLTESNQDLSISPKALTYNASSRTKELSKPHGEITIPYKYRKPEESIPRRVLEYQASPRICYLAQPKPWFTDSVESLVIEKRIFKRRKRINRKNELYSEHLPRIVHRSLPKLIDYKPKRRSHKISEQQPLTSNQRFIVFRKSPYEGEWGKSERIAEQAEMSAISLKPDPSKEIKKLVHQCMNRKFDPIQIKRDQKIKDAEQRMKDREARKKRKSKNKCYAANSTNGPDDKSGGTGPQNNEYISDQGQDNNFRSNSPNQDSNSKTTGVTNYQNMQSQKPKSKSFRDDGKSSQSKVSMPFHKPKSPSFGDDGKSSQSKNSMNSQNSKPQSAGYDGTYSQSKNSMHMQSQKSKPQSAGDDGKSSPSKNSMQSQMSKHPSSRDGGKSQFKTFAHQPAAGNAAGKNTNLQLGKSSNDKGFDPKNREQDPIKPALQRTDSKVNSSLTVPHKKIAFADSNNLETRNSRETLPLKPSQSSSGSNKQHQSNPKPQSNIQNPFDPHVTDNVIFPSDQASLSKIQQSPISSTPSKLSKTDSFTRQLSRSNSKIQQKPVSDISSKSSKTKLSSAEISKPSSKSSSQAASNTSMKSGGNKSDGGNRSDNDSNRRDDRKNKHTRERIERVI